jgi:hypothetical protein
MCVGHHSSRDMHEERFVREISSSIEYPAYEIQAYPLDCAHGWSLLVLTMLAQAYTPRRGLLGVCFNISYHSKSKDAMGPLAGFPKSCIKRGAIVPLRGYVGPFPA